MVDQTITLLIGFGGLALFLYGILLLSDGLKEAAGNRFSLWIARVSRRRWRGYALGMAMGTAVQSSASTVMTVGFLNAGLITLASAIPLVAGANLGTSIAMQIIALDIEWLWPVLALVGLPLRLWPGDIHRRRVGQALMGLALLFLGLRLMSQSLYPFRTLLSGLLTDYETGDHLALLMSLGGSLLFTALVQSSSATMGILFSMAGAGIFTDLSHVVPLVVGAQIGTCITALLSSIGTNSDARRGALAHLYFNLIAGSIGMILMPWIAQAVTALPVPPARQVATVHTIIMVMGGLLIVPLTPWMERLLRFTARFANRANEQSFLAEEWVATPARALDACDLELTRITRLIRRGFALNRELAASPSRRTQQFVKQTEDSVDLIHHSMRQYLMRIAGHVDNQQDASRLQWTNMFLIYLERISDHNENLAYLTLDMNMHMSPEDLPYARTMWDSFFRTIEPLLALLETAWVPGDPPRLERARQLRELRARYLPESEQRQNEIVARTAAHQLHPLSGFFMIEFVSEMDRIVRHTKKIAGLLEKSAP